MHKICSAKLMQVILYFYVHRYYGKNNRQSGVGGRGGTGLYLLRHFAFLSLHNSLCVRDVHSIIW